MTLNNVMFKHLNESISLNVEKVRFAVRFVPVLMSFNFNYLAEAFECENN